MIKIVAVIVSLYLSMTFLGGALQGTEGGIVCVVTSSLWIGIAILIARPFKNKPEGSEE